MKLNKKGQAVTFGNAPSIVVALMLAGLTAAAGIIALVAMKSGQGVTTTADNSSVVNTSLDRAVTGVGNFTAQLGTVGTMIGIGLVLLVIVGVFAFGLMRRGGGGSL